eukprot:TRINITY_DN9171_c0_g1_i1.p1 TRINITY_DN9171_c0_g1~~TRINITY_DN9171_c0_g1_i1.p1  ORF type:complete len:190 (-),score=41.63 TRINITY_DN9171_c0_g1_i1:238-807(-)
MTEECVQSVLVEHEEDPSVCATLQYRDQEIKVLRARLLMYKHRAQEEDLSTGRLEQLEEQLALERSARHSLEQELAELKMALARSECAPSPQVQRVRAPGTGGAKQRLQHSTGGFSVSQIEQPIFGDGPLRSSLAAEGPSSPGVWSRQIGRAYSKRTSAFQTLQKQGPDNKPVAHSARTRSTDQAPPVA